MCVCIIQVWTQKTLIHQSLLIIPTHACPTSCNYSSLAMVHEPTPTHSIHGVQKWTPARTKRTSELKSPGTRSWSVREQVSLAQSNITTDRRQRQPSITSAALFSLTSSTKAERVKKTILFQHVRCWVSVNRELCSPRVVCTSGRLKPQSWGTSREPERLRVRGVNPRGSLCAYIFANNL